MRWLMENKVASLVAIILFLLLLQPHYYAEDAVKVLKLDSENNQAAVISVTGGVDDFSLMSLGFTSEKSPVRHWLFSGNISSGGEVKITHVNLKNSTECDKVETQALKIGFQDNVGAVTNVTLKGMQSINCNKILSIRYLVDGNPIAKELSYKIAPYKRCGVYLKTVGHLFN